MTLPRPTPDPSFFNTPDFSAFAPRLRPQADLSRTNWFRVGGPAEWLFRPESSADLAAFLRVLPAEVPVTVLGVGSNLIVRDGGIDGVVVRLGRGFTDIAAAGCDVVAGAAALDVHVAHVAGEAGVSGFEFLSGIPGTIGGAVRMNAGAYGHDTAHILMYCEVVTRDGQVQMLTGEELGFTYRCSRLPDGAVVTRAWMRGAAGDRALIAARMQEIQEARESTQPVRSRTGGSTFKNPEGYRAWELIDRAGCRGLRLGAAQMSELHCNFLMNTGGATAAELEALGEEVRRRVAEATGVTLEWEIRRIGRTP